MLRLAVFYFILFLFQTKAFAQFPGNRKVNVENFSQSTYKAANQNWAIADAGDGMVYFANNNGLLIYDGIKWELCKIPELNLVRSLALANDSVIYMGGFEEFGYIKNIHKRPLEYVSVSKNIPHDLLHNQEIWRIFIHKQKVYFQSFGVIYVLHPDGKLTQMLPPNNSAFVLLNLASNRLFIHEIGFGLHEIVDGKFVYLSGSEVFARDEVKTIVPFQGENFLVGTAQHGFYVYDGNAFLPWNTSVNRQIKNAEINHCIAIDSSNYILGTIVEGVYIFNSSGAVLQHISTKEFLQNNTVLGLQADAYGNVWVALDRGIDYIRMNDPLNFYLSPNTSSRSVYDAKLYRDKLWLATNQGVFVYDGNDSLGLSTQYLVPGSQGQAWKLEIIDNQLYCGHNNGTYLINEYGVTLVSTEHGGFMIKPLRHNSSDFYIQSTYNSLVLFKLQHGRLNQLHTIQGFREPVPHFEIDHMGNIWAAHMKHGLYKIKLNSDATFAEKVVYYGVSQGLPTDKEISVCKIDGRIVICTGEKLFTYDDLNDTIVEYTKLNAALGEFSKSDKIVSDENHNYWCMLGNKVALFRIQETAVSRIISYNLERQGVFLTHSFPNIAFLSDSLHLICLDNGFALFRIGENLGQAKPEMKIRYIRVYDTDNKEVYDFNPPLELNLKHKHSTVEISFSPLQQMVNPLFRYRLIGYNSNWSEWATSALARFERLPPGHFRFEVQMIGIDGSLSDVQAFNFQILPPWYNSLPAYMLYSLAIMVLILVFRIYFKKRIQQQANQLNLKEMERHIHEKMEAEQELILLRNQKLQDELTRQNIDLANFTLNASKTNELLGKLKDEILQQKTELGNRYPKYYSERLLKLIEANETNEDAWQMFEMHFDKVNNQFFKRLKEAYPDLTPSDMKLCAFLRLNLNTKEIAPLLNITIRGVEIRRYRLRKRLGLHTEDNLIEFIMKF